MNTYSIYQQWVNGSKHWTTVNTKMSLTEAWYSLKKTYESMGMKLIAITLNN